MGTFRRLLPLVTWVATLTVAIALFTSLGNGPLAAPPLTTPSAWGEWAAAREPVVATVAILRLAALAMAWYLVGVTTIGAVARVAQLASLVRVTDALSVPLVRRVLQTSLGIGLATTVVATAASGVVAPRPDLPSMQPVAGGAGTDLEPPGMRPLDTPLDTPGGDVGAPTPQAVEAPVVADAKAAPDDVATHEVRTGDHLWSIARDHLAAVTDDVDPSDVKVAAHWRDVIDANRDRLVDPDNPDLLLPGQEVVLPAVREGEQR